MTSNRRGLSVATQSRPRPFSALALAAIPFGSHHLFDRIARRAGEMNTLRTGMLLAALTAIFGGVGYLIGGGSGAAIALIFAGVMNFFTYWNADRLVLRMRRAREVEERTAPELYGLVRELADRAGLPMPRVYIADNPQPNAFATGRNPQHAAVCATTGLLQTLDRDEIAGVIAHELGH